MTECRYSRINVRFFITCKVSAMSVRSPPLQNIEGVAVPPNNLISLPRCHKYGGLVKILNPIVVFRVQKQHCTVCRVGSIGYCQF